MIGVFGGDGGRAAVAGEKCGRRVLAAPDDAHDGAGLLRGRAAHGRSVDHTLGVSTRQYHGLFFTKLTTYNRASQLINRNRSVHRGYWY